MTDLVLILLLLGLLLLNWLLLGLSSRHMLEVRLLSEVLGGWSWEKTY